jgi:hypothetical protein
MAKKPPARPKSKRATRKSARTPRTARKITVEATLLADLQGQLAAIGKSLAVIEFDLNGHILTPMTTSWTRWVTGSRKSRVSITACLSSPQCAPAMSIAVSGRSSVAASCRRGARKGTSATAPANHGSDHSHRGINRRHRSDQGRVGPMSRALFDLIVHGSSVPGIPRLQ